MLLAAGFWLLASGRQSPTKYTMRNFYNYEIWQKSIAITKEVYMLTLKLPVSEKYGLLSQMRRAAVSISSNIAEGSSRSSDKEFARYLEISIGSSFELETQIIIGKEIGYFDEIDAKTILDNLHALQKQVSRLIQKLNNEARK